MAIIYSYPGATPTLSDTVLGTKFSGNGNTTRSFLIADIISLVQPGVTPTLNTVLAASNTSLLDAKIGDLYLFDDTDGEYGKISIYDSNFNVFKSSGTSMFTVDGGNLTLNNGNATANISNSLTTPRTYTLPDKSGTFALTSDTTLQQVTTAGNATNLPITVASLITTGQALIGTTVTGTPVNGSTPNLVVTFPYSGTNSGGVIDLRSLNPNTTAGTVLGKIQFTGKSEAFIAYTNAAIECIAFANSSTGSSGGGILKFMTSPNQTGGAPIERMRITEVGVVQPGVDNSYSLGASGIRWSAVWAANGAIQTSDEREKKDIVDSDLGLDFISKLRPVSFKWKVGKNEVTSEPDGLDEEGNPKAKTVITPIEGKRTHYGLIAQEVEALLSGKDFGGFIHDDETGIKGLRYDQFIPVLINAIKELKAEIEILKVK